ncbi:phosphoglycerate dehydrogenase-like enzyme [Salinibacterium sp. CAN_S4]|uniref:D-isomer specific 2-hydroxyacid dehydrogenase family protein n=1 Tax=Salinibacterium sp. CAN_S4 TaxID=2787727 RepID=UPI001A25E22A
MSDVGSTRAPGQHRDPVAALARPIDGTRPAAGPVAILPFDHDGFAAAVRDGGGAVGPLDGCTRGIVWLDLDGDALGEVLAAHPAVEWVQVPMAGVERFARLFEAQGSRDLPLWTSAKGSFAEPVAEHAVALTLAVLRGLPEKSRSTSWADPKTGISLYGRNVLIVGAGGIAREIMRLLAPFEVSVTIVRRTAGDVPGARRTVAASGLMEVLPDADVVILAAAATDQTAHLIGRDQLAAMKPSAALVNIARGHLIDQDALADALAGGHLVGAGLDVTTPEPLPDGHPLWSSPRIVITSHSADTPEMTEPLLAERIRANVAALVGDGAFVGIVDPVAGY